RGGAGRLNWQGWPKKQKKKCPVTADQRERPSGCPRWSAHKPSGDEERLGIIMDAIRQIGGDLVGRVAAALQCCELLAVLLDDYALTEHTSPLCAVGDVVVCSIREAQVITATTRQHDP